MCPYGEPVAVLAIEPKFSGSKLMQLIMICVSAEYYSAKEALNINFVSQSLNSSEKFYYQLHRKMGILSVKLYINVLCIGSDSILFAVMGSLKSDLSSQC